MKYNLSAEIQTKISDKGNKGYWLKSSLTKSIKNITSTMVARHFT